jgi:hypothetical protein
MALADKKYEGFYTTSGSDADKIDSNKLAHIKDLWDKDVASGRNVTMLEDPHIGPLLYQLQQMQDELDEIRRHVVNDVVGQTGATGPQGPTGAAGAAGATGATGPAQTDPSQLDGTQLPTSNKNLSTGDLWNDKGIVKVA